MENKTIEKPEILTDDHLFYLDELRESGITNIVHILWMNLTCAKQNHERY